MSPVFGKTGAREITHDVDEIDHLCPRWPRCPRFWEGEGAACARTGKRSAARRWGATDAHLPGREVQRRYDLAETGPLIEQLEGDGDGFSCGRCLGHATFRDGADYIGGVVPADAGVVMVRAY